MRKPSFPLLLSALAVLLLTAATLPVVWARQTAPASDAAQDSSQGQAQDQDQSVSTLKVNVDVVQLFFNVKEKKGGLISNLTKDDFEVYEDGKPQTIKYFAANSDLPLTLGILIDTSPSQQRVLGMEQEVGASFLSQILRDKDLAFVVSFDADENLLQDFTNSAHLLKVALNSAHINGGTGGGGGIAGMGGGPVPTMNHGCCTMLYDAVYAAAHEELAQQVGRKAMILLTDGEDDGSKLKLIDAIEAAQKADTIAYVLLCADRGFYGFGGYSGDSEMKKLTQETGGRVIDVGNKLDKLRDAFDQIAKELRSQYNIGYVPTNRNKDGGFRKVEIRSKAGYKVQSRAGYYAVAHQQ
jgi:VWFA-related protein